MKKRLAMLLLVVMSALALSVESTAFAETGEASVQAENLTIEECIDYVNEMDDIDEQNAPDVGVYMSLITEEEEKIIARVLEHDYSSAETTEYCYKESKYDFTSKYYYNRLPARMQKAYDCLDEACSEFLISSIDLSSNVINTVKLEEPLASADGG